MRTIVKNGEMREMTPEEEQIFELGIKEAQKEIESFQWIQNRREEYPAIGDQLDAILKGFNQLRLSGTNLPSDLDNVIQEWLDVKKKHKKPEEA